MYILYRLIYTYVYTYIFVYIYTCGLSMNIYVYIYIIHIYWYIYICILNGKHWNHEPSKIHTFIFFHLPRHWHCIGTATCEIGPRRTKGLGIWVSKGGTAAVFPCSPSQSSCLGGSEPPPSPEKIDVGEKIKVQTSRGWETLRTACSFFLRPELQFFFAFVKSLF